MPDWSRFGRRFLVVLIAALCGLLLQARSLAAQTDVIRGRVTGADGSPLAQVRVTATSISSSGFADDTDQSLPNATTAPLRYRLPIG